MKKTTFGLNRYFKKGFTWKIALALSAIVASLILLGIYIANISKPIKDPYEPQDGDVQYFVPEDFTDQEAHEMIDQDNYYSVLSKPKYNGTVKTDFQTPLFCTGTYDSTYGGYMVTAMYLWTSHGDTGSCYTLTTPQSYRVYTNGGTWTSNYYNVVGIANNCQVIFKHFVRYPDGRGGCDEQYNGNCFAIKITSNIKKLGAGAFSNPSFSNTQKNTVPGFTEVSDKCLIDLSEATGLEVIEDFAFYSLNANQLSTEFKNEYKAKLISDGYTAAAADSLINNNLAASSKIKIYSLPQSFTNLKKVGKFAFAGCSIFNNVSLPNVQEIDDYAFYRCNNLSTLTLSDKNLKAGLSPFLNTKIHTVTFGNAGTAVIGNTLFKDTTTLTTINGKLKSCGEYCFANTGITSIDDIYIENIGAHAFDGCQGITSVSLANTKTVGDYAFANLNNLTTLNLDGVERIGAYCFANDTNLTNAKFDLVKYIGDYAFFNCTGLTRIVPYEAIEIGTGAFKNCTGVKVLELGDELTSIGANAFENMILIEEVVVPSKVEQIDSGAFKGCIKLAQADMQCDVLGENLFESCSSLSILNISPSVTEIPDGAFYGCAILTEINISNNVTKIGASSYSGTSITSYVIPDSCTIIGDNAFENCSILSTINLNNTEILGSAVFRNCGSLNNVLIPNSVNEVGTNLFENCTSLTNITFEDNDRLNESMFKGCTSLIDVNFASPETITEIPFECFMNCTSLNELDVLYLTEAEKTNSEKDIHVTTIGGYAFYNTAFTTVYLSDILEDAGEYSFSSMSKLTTLLFEAKDVAPYMFYNCDALTTATFRGVYGAEDAYLTVTDNSASMIQALYGTDSYQTAPTGNFSFASCDALVNITFDNFKEIGDYMFYKCGTVSTGLAYVELPATITTVGTHAFADCLNLSDVDLYTVNLGEYMFYRDNKLTSIELPQTLKAIPAYAFYKSALTEITIPETVETVGRSAFEDSDSLSTIILNNSVIGERMFFGCEGITTYTFKNFTSIGAYAFANCIRLKSVYFASSATRIGSHMFDGCTSLGTEDNYTLTIPSGITNVGTYAFANCSSLTAVEIENHSISDYEFYRSGLQSVEIPSHVTSIGAYAFRESKLVSADIQNTTISTQEFYGCTLLENVTISDSVTSIGSYAFSGCTALPKIEFGINSRLTTINSYAFNNCSKFVEFVVPNSVTLIDDSAFRDCSKLERITLPFIGRTKSATGWQGVFGYIFGTYSSSSYADYNYYYVPTTLINVLVTDDDNVNDYAFYNLAS